MKKIMEMMGKSTGHESSTRHSEMSEMEQKAKMEVLKELFEMAMQASGEGVSKGMQELTVAAPDKEGILKGLEKAEDIMEDMPENPLEGMESSKHEEDEYSEDMMKSSDYDEDEEDEDEDK